MFGRLIASLLIACMGFGVPMSFADKWEDFDQEDVSDNEAKAAQAGSVWTTVGYTAVVVGGGFAAALYVGHLVKRAYHARPFGNIGSYDPRDDNKVILDSISKELGKTPKFLHGLMNPFYVELVEAYKKLGGEIN